VTNNLKNISHLTFSTQNCNSLNISTNCPKQGKKIAAILALQTTIIFLSDIRLNTNNVPFNNFFSPRYDMIHNSTENRRGVGILISRTLQYTLLNEYRDNNNNVLALRIDVCGTIILLISVYGPNNNDMEFYTYLRNIRYKYPGIPTICAGDWNATYCTENGEGNIDIFNMSKPPSVVRSGWLADIYDNFNMSDPFRAIHYAKKEYTYVPRDGGKNRSRIDFFKISDCLLSL
jgi:exonuclease III